MTNFDCNLHLRHIFNAIQHILKKTLNINTIAQLDRIGIDMNMIIMLLMP